MICGGMRFAGARQGERRRPPLPRDKAGQEAVEEADLRGQTRRRPGKAGGARHAAAGHAAAGTDSAKVRKSDRADHAPAASETADIRQRSRTLMRTAIPSCRLGRGQPAQPLSLVERRQRTLDNLAQIGAAISATLSRRRSVRVGCV